MSSQSNTETHPRGFKFIFWGELAERSSFYGMKALLAMYLVAVMGYKEEDAGPINHAFTAMCYLLPIAGGFIADRWLGKYKTIIWFAVPYILGHIILGNAETRPVMFLALALLAMGSGVIKPNLSPLMGMMYDAEGKSKDLRAKAFSYFYAAINIGAAASMLTLPLVRDKYGYETALMFPAGLMAASLLIFAIGKNHYPKEAPKTKITLTAAEKAEDRKALTSLGGIFTLLVFFWAIFDQASSTWVYFARDHLELYGMAPDMLQGLNPVLVVIMTPFFANIWSWWGNRRGRAFTATGKMMVGFVLVIICMVTMGIAGWLATSSGVKVSGIWEMVAYVIITIAELCISVVGLEMAYSEAPPRMKSTITAVFLFTVFIGNFLAGAMSAIYPKVNPGNYFMALAGLMIIVALAFRKVGKRFDEGKGA